MSSTSRPPCPRPPPRPRPPPPPRPAPSAWRPAWSFDVLLGASLETRRLPGHPAGAALGLGLVAPHGGRLDLVATAFATARASDPDGASALAWRAAGLTGCPPPLALAGLGVRVCAGLEVGWIAARGDGFVTDRAAAQLAVDGLLELRAELGLGRRGFARLGAIGRAAAVRPRFGYRDEAGDFVPLYTPAIVGGTALLGVGLRFP